MTGLNTEQIQIIKATVPVLVEHGNTITTVFYRNMLAAHTELNDVFNISHQRTGQQPRALTGALFAYASHIDNLGVLGPAVESICNKHASLYIRPDDYSIVGKYLIEAMGEVLGEALTPDIQDAWAAAYWQLANFMIGRERQLYDHSEGWTSWRDFTIVDKVKESDKITSFYLSPVDGKMLPLFRPGQYISVQVYVPELKYFQARQYSLSEKPSRYYYRISVKREGGLNNADMSADGHHGYVSTLLHDTFNKGDTVKVSYPCGDFFLSETNTEPTHPIVLISAGVGLTPLTSILNTLTSQSISSKCNLHFIHGARTSHVRAFKEHISNLVSDHPTVRATFFTSHPSDEEKPGVDYHHLGRIDLSKLDANSDLFLDNPKTEYYICGPESFMTNTQMGLLTRGISPDRIKMELFGTGGVGQ